MVAGYTGTEYLAAASISDLWTQSTGVFIMGGVLGMFCSQAIGAGNKELAGIWLQVGAWTDFLSIQSLRLSFSNPSSRSSHSRSHSRFRHSLP